VTIVEPAAGKDISDHLAAGKSLDDVVVTWTSEKPWSWTSPRICMSSWRCRSADDVGRSRLARAWRPADLDWNRGDRQKPGSADDRGSRCSWGQPFTGETFESRRVLLRGL